VVEKKKTIAPNGLIPALLRQFAKALVVTKQNNNEENNFLIS